MWWLGGQPWIQPDAPCWQRAPGRWPWRRALSPQGLPCRSTKKATSASTTRRPAPGFPLLVIPGGGLNSTIAGLKGSSRRSIRWRSSRHEYRCITADLRNANGGQSTGPLEIDRPWDAYTDDQLGLMDHLGIEKFMVLGFCIGGPFIWNLLKRAPDRIVAAVLAQPSGFRPEMPDLFYDNNMKGWGPPLRASGPTITMAMVDAVPDQDVPHAIPTSSSP